MANSPRRKSQSAGFVAPGVDVLSAFNPQTTAYDGGYDGNPIGTDRKSGMPVDVDSGQLMIDERIGSRKAMVLGMIGDGKTTLLKDIVFQGSKVNAGGRRARTSIDDINRRNGRPEYEIFAQEMRCASIRLGEHPINPFDVEYGFTQAEHLITVNQMFAYANTDPATSHQDYGHRVALAKMYREMPEIASPQTLRTILQYMNDKDIDLYMKENNDKIPADMGVEELPEKLKDLIARGKTTVVYEELLRDVGRSYERIDQILEGEFGRVFGAGKSIARKLQQRVVVKDYSGLNDSAASLMQSFMWRLRNFALKNNDRRFMVQQSVNDENYKMWRIPGYAQNMSDAMKQGRGNEEFMLFATHRVRDYSTAGPIGSTARDLATNIFSDIELFFIGRQTKRDLDDLSEIMDITDHEREMILSQGRGEFAMKIGTEPMVFIETRSTFTPIKEKFSRSNGAVDNLMERDRIVEDEFVQLTEDELREEWRNEEADDQL